MRAGQEPPIDYIHSPRTLPRSRIFFSQIDGAGEDRLYSRTPRLPTSNDMPAPGSRRSVDHEDAHSTDAACRPESRSNVSLRGGNGRHYEPQHSSGDQRRSHSRPLPSSYSNSIQAVSGYYEGSYPPHDSYRSYSPPTSRFRGYAGRPRGGDYKHHSSQTPSYDTRRSELSPPPPSLPPPPPPHSPPPPPPQGLPLMPHSSSDISEGEIRTNRTAYTEHFSEADRNRSSARRPGAPVI